MTKEDIREYIRTRLESLLGMFEIDEITGKPKGRDILMGCLARFEIEDIMSFVNKI